MFNTFFIVCRSVELLYELWKNVSWVTLYSMYSIYILEHSEHVNIGRELFTTHYFNNSKTQIQSWFVSYLDFIVLSFIFSEFLYDLLCELELLSDLSRDLLRLWCLLLWCFRGVLLRERDRPILIVIFTVHSFQHNSHNTRILSTEMENL